MSTRSSIAVEKADGKVEAVYCHFDGYLDGVGETLVLNFDSQELAEGLVSLGGLSTVAGAKDLNDVEAYARDRGERFEDNAPEVFTDLADYRARVGTLIGDNGYRYIFTKGEWAVWGRGASSDSFIKVEEALAKGEES